jgi:sodium-dependent phosphate cotransporter
MTSGEKCKAITINVVKIMTVFGLLYFFICSLDLLSSAFKLISGKTTSELINNNPYS